MAVGERGGVFPPGRLSPERQTNPNTDATPSRRPTRYGCVAKGAGRVGRGGEEGVRVNCAGGSVPRQAAEPVPRQPRRRLANRSAGVTLEGEKNPRENERDPPPRPARAGAAKKRSPVQVGAVLAPFQKVQESPLYIGKCGSRLHKTLFFNEPDFCRTMTLQSRLHDKVSLLQ